MTGIYSILHMLVDGVCALAMFGHFALDEKWYLYVLLYNFCAFALQMPLGVVLDAWNERKSKCKKYVRPHFLFVLLGVLLTLVGAVAHPIVLGLGNALFHLGGGVGTIEEDNAKGWQGRGLGVFVAPGAIGLFLGTQLAQNGGMVVGLVGTGVGMLLLSVWGWFVSKRLVRVSVGEECVTSNDNTAEQHTYELLNNDKKTLSVAIDVQEEWGKDISDEYSKGVLKKKIIFTKKKSVLLIWGCFFVVALRSYLGMTISFPWKTTLLAGVLAVLATALGKAAGGFGAAGFGWRKTAIVSLGVAAVCYVFPECMPVGLLALFCFNMTMPITLYLLVQELKNLPGFAFGILTFSLFLGFLPEYFGMDKLADGRLVGCVGSLLSMLILLVCVRRERGKV